MKAEDAEIETWHQADELFGQLLDLPEAEWPDFLAELTAGQAVRQRLTELLAAHRRSSGPLERPLLLGKAAAFRQENALRGKRLGRWYLDSELGRGGSAVVYRAWREEGERRQRAAIKVLTFAALGNSGGERFRREAAILAQLNHPNITPLLDSGVGEDGTWWMAMPLVDGERIDQWCQVRKLNSRALVQLFLQVCDAVASAHRALIIHRDLKPSNVLVESGGHVRLLDFGIGRFTDDNSEERTRTFWRALTPEYAAPEQFAGAAPSTAMDVYGLGALLHKLLTGRTVRAGTDLGNYEFVLTRPSLLAKGNPPVGASHYHALKSDLDRVLVKALAPEPERRYRSVEALADDLGRWLAGEPVLAQPPGLPYRLKKFVLRNKTLASLALVLAIGVAGTLWQAGQARYEREIARAELARATELNRFIVGLFEATAPVRVKSELPTTQELLERGIARARDLAVGDAALRADMLAAIGTMYYRSGDLERAAELSAEALALARGLSPPQPLLLARALRVQTAVYLLNSDPAAAEGMLDEVEDLLRDHDPGGQLRIENLLDRAELLGQTGRLRECIALLEQLHAQVARRVELPQRLRQEITLELAWAYAKQDRLPEARKLYHKLLDDSAAYRSQNSLLYANALVHSANTDSQLGLFAEAERQFAEALVIYRQLSGRFSRYSAFAHQLRGHHLWRRGQIAESLAVFAQAQREWSEVLKWGAGEQHPLKEYQSLFALNAGLRWRQMEEAARREMSFLGDKIDSHPRQQLFMNIFLAKSLCYRGAPQEAQALLAQARELQSAPALQRMLAYVQEAEALCLLAQGQQRAALGKLEQAVANNKQLPPGQISVLVMRELMLAELLHSLGETGRAGRLKAEALARLDGINYAADAPLRHQPLLPPALLPHLPH